MPQLRRHGRLLGTVEGKPHATQDDHYDALPTPPASNGTRSSGTKSKAEEEKEEDDVYGSPKSTDDEDESVNRPASRGKFQTSRQLNVSGDASEVKPSGFRMPQTFHHSPESTRSKRSAEESDGAGHESEDAIFGSSQRSFSISPNKKHKAHMGNIHAPASRKPRTTYTKKGQHGSQPRSSQPFKKPSETPKPSPLKGPAFKSAAGSNMFTFKGNDSTFKADKGETATSRSPSLSSALSEPDSDIEEIDATQLGLPHPTPYVPKVDCRLCNARVPLLVWQAFEDKYPKGKGREYKYQKWFCNFHKVTDAQAVWEERGYPDIEWSKLDRRLKRHHKHLISVLEGNTPSIYREELQKQVDAGGGKSALAALATSKDDGGDQNLNFTPGYYGPRGEKIVMEHVSSHFSDRLRELATSDPLIAAFGVKGGVSGFTQGVLVPELVVSLVMEDLKVLPMRAREILRESKELGELLSEEMGEKVSSIEMEE